MTRCLPRGCSHIPMKQVIFHGYVTLPNDALLSSYGNGRFETQQPSNPATALRSSFPPTPVSPALSLITKSYVQRCQTPIHTNKQIISSFLTINIYKHSIKHLKTSHNRFYQTHSTKPLKENPHPSTHSMKQWSIQHLQRQAATDQVFLRGHRRFSQQLPAELRELRHGAQGFAAQAVAVHRHQQAVPLGGKNRMEDTWKMGVNMGNIWKDMIVRDEFSIFDRVILRFDV